MPKQTKKTPSKKTKRKFAPILRELESDSPALKRARAAFLATLPAHARKSMERLIMNPAHRQAFNEYREPTVDTLEQAKADFDAAGIKCMTACLELSSVMPGSARAATALLACACAGDELTEAYAAVLRARDATPIPHALTDKSMRELDAKRDPKAWRKSTPGPSYKRGGSK